MTCFAVALSLAAIVSTFVTVWQVDREDRVSTRDRKGRRKGDLFS
jgi:hypothetical protein